MRKWLLVSGFLAVCQVGAEEFYCGNTIVEQGMTMAQVSEICGEPGSKVENAWYYLQGPGQLVKVVYFNGGVVDYIKEEAPTLTEEQDQDDI